ncbi:KIAA1875 [Bugula neritina]|uniref:KIAA1875 n=1 Tax=Bugula neritina TaxID=10212 RepID=A0A7J7KEB5_BUGNE|nr:KIAA1875 [Bugula neritina]
MKDYKNSKRINSAGSEKVKDERGEEIKAARQVELKLRIRYLWNRLRETILDTANASLENDVKQRHVSHGVHFQRQIMHRNAITTAFHNTTTDEYISVDEEAIRIFHSSGMRKNIFMPSEDINRLCYIKHINSYVGWKYKQPTLYLYGSDFELYSQADAPSELYQVIYNEPKEELIVCGNGYLLCYVFRFGNRHLIARHTRMEHEILEGRELHLLALEDTPSRTQKCYVAFDACLAVFSVSDMQFVCWRKNLHQRDITALLFFNPLKYLISAAYDGSIKVWSSDWKLQFVFVGHTKSVTGLANYPWGPQFLSLSTDQTMRVWNLEVLDQVDKQELDDNAVGIFTSLGNTNFCTHSDHVLHLWTVDDLHRVHTIVGYQVSSVKCTVHPNFPPELLSLVKTLL